MVITIKDSPHVPVIVNRESLQVSDFPKRIKPERGVKEHQNRRQVQSRLTGGRNKDAWHTNLGGRQAKEDVVCVLVVFGSGGCILHVIVDVAVVVVIGSSFASFFTIQRLMKRGEARR